MKPENKLSRQQTSPTPLLILSMQMVPLLHLLSSTLCKGNWLALLTPTSGIWAGLG